MAESHRCVVSVWYPPFQGPGMVLKRGHDYMLLMQKLVKTFYF